MKSSLKRFALVGVMAGVVTFGIGAGRVMAQAAAGSRGGEVVHSGNTEIVFEAAGTQGLPMDRYQAFENFAQQNPAIAKALAHNPRLINSESFADKYPALGEFLKAHPEVKSDFAANPGNYVDMPVAVAAQLKRKPIESQ